MIEAEHIETIEPSPPRFSLVPFNEAKISDGPRYLVKGLIPHTGLVVIWGPPKCGKSFWTFDLAMHVALGWEYRGRRVYQGVVAFVACEGAEGFKARIEAFRQARLAEDADTINVPFFLIPCRLNLIAEHQTLIDDIRHQLGDTVPAVVVIDTLNRSISSLPMISLPIAPKY